MFIIGTSIGFKNIASKIAYDLRLWLDSKPVQQSDDLESELLHEPDYDEEYEEMDDDVVLSADDKSISSNDNKTRKSSNNRNIKIGYNNIIASLLRTTTL